MDELKKHSGANAAGLMGFRRSPARGFLVFFALAIVVRTVGLHHIPPGDWYDEAINGLDALSVIDAVREGRAPPIFFATEDHPREPLFIYATAATFLVAGATTWALRWTAAWIGALTVAAFWLMLRRLRGEAVAFVAALGLVFFRWHVHFSRTSFRTIAAPLFLCLLVWAIDRAARGRRARDWALAGVFLGAGFYTYLSFRFVPVLLVLWALAALWREVGRLRNSFQDEEGGPKGWPHWKGAALGLVVAVVVFAPLGVDYLRHPFHFRGRVDQVSLFDEGLAPGLRAVAQNAVVNVLQFFIPGQGDHVPKHNIPYRAVFDPLNALVFLVGLIFCLWRAFRPPKEPDASASAWPVLALLWLGLMLLGSVFSFGAPNLLRTVAGAPAAIWIWAEGVWVVALLVKRIAAAPVPQGNQTTEATRTRRPIRIDLVVATALLVGFGAMQSYEYFILYPKSEGLWSNFNVGETQVGRALRPLDPAKETAWIGEKILAHPTVQFESLGAPAARPLRLPEALARDPEAPGRDHLILVTMYNQLDRRLGDALPTADIERRFLLPDGRTAWAVLIRVKAADLLSPEAAARRAGPARVVQD